MNRDVDTYFERSKPSHDIYSGHLHLGQGQSGATTTSQWTISLTRRGRVIYRIADETILGVAGDLLVVKPHTWHYWGVPCIESDNSLNTTGDKCSDDRWESMFAAFHPRPHWIAWLEGLDYRDGFALIPFNGETLAALAQNFLNLTRIYARGGLLRDLKALHALENALLTVHENNARMQTALDMRIHDAIEFIHLHYSATVTIADLARTAGVSASHFTKLFTTIVKARPIEYLQNVRLDRAAEMLRYSSVDIKDIAPIVGYSDPKYFARCFRQRYSVSPRQYRTTVRSAVTVEHSNTRQS